VDITIRLRDGTTLEGRSDITSGEPTRPHAPAALAEKYIALAEPIWGASRAAQLRDVFMSLESCPDVSHLTDFNP
jgi:hypothetical protein